MRKMLIWISGAVLVWLAVLGLLYGSRNIWLPPVLKRALLSAAKRELGLDLAIGRVGGNYLSALDLEQVRTRHLDLDGPLVSLRIKRLQVRYSLPALLFGNGNFLEKITLDLQGVQARIKLAAEAAAQPSPASPANRRAAAVAVPVLPALPKIHIRDARISLAAPFLSAPELRVESRPGGAGGNRIHLAAAAVDLFGPVLMRRRISVEADIEQTPARISFERLWVDGRSVMETAWFQFQHHRLEDFKVDLRFDRTRWFAAGQWRGGRVNAEFAFDLPGMERVADWVELPFGGLQGDLEARGQAGLALDQLLQSAGTVSLRWDRGRLAGRPVDRLEVFAALQNGTLRLDRAGLASGANQAELRDFSAPLAPLVQGRWGPWLRAVRGTFTAALADIPAAIGTALPDRPRVPRHALNLRGDLGNGELRLREGVMDVFQDRARIDRLTIGLEALAGPWQEIAFDAGAVLQAADLSAWTGLLGLPRIRGSAQIELEGRGRLSDFTASARVQGANLGYQLSGADAFSAQAGSLDLQATLQGSIERPDFIGQCALEDGQVKFSPEVPPLRDIRLNAELNSSRTIIRRLAATVGGSPVSLSGTVAEVFTARRTFDVQLQGLNLLLYRSADLRLRADADLAVQGPLERLRVSGEARLTDGLYSRDIDFLGFLRPNVRPRERTGLVLFTLPDPPFDHMQFAVRITTTEPFLIKNNAVTGSVMPELLLGGTGEVPVLKGTVYINPGTVALPTGSLAVRSGVVRFLENAPDRPRLDILAGAKMQGYDITLRVAGPYDRPVVTLTSDPPAPHDQLLLLVLTGQSPQPQAGQRFVSTGNLALFLGQGAVGTLFGEGGRRFWERLQMSIGQEISRNGNETLNAQFQLARDWLTTQDVVYLTSERDAYDDFNAGAKIVFQFK